MIIIPFVQVCKGLKSKNSYVTTNVQSNKLVYSKRDAGEVSVLPHENVPDSMCKARIYT